MDERRLLQVQKRLAGLKLLIIDELGFVPLPMTESELLFKVFTHRYERGAILVTCNMLFDEWTEVLGSERLTGALLDRLTHHVHTLEMNGESFRLRQSRQTNQYQPTDYAEGLTDHDTLILTPHRSVVQFISAPDRRIFN